MPHQNATRSLSELYVWRLESIYQGTNYIPYLTDESKILYEAYQEQYRCNPLSDGTIYAGNKRIEMMAEQKKEVWKEMITSIDLTHNSRKVWKVTKSISNDPTTPTPP